MRAWEKYIYSVQSGERLAGELEKLAVERFLRLCADPKYYFDTKGVEKCLSIIGHFKHTKGTAKGEPFNILPWQAFAWAWMFGLKHKGENLRVTREVLLCMAKKGGKSEFAGATMLYLTFFDGEPGAEVYSAANSYDQAAFSWNAGAVMAQQLRDDDPDFAAACAVYDSANYRMIKDLETGSFFKPIAAISHTLDGVNPAGAVVDEFHEARDDSIPKNLRSGMVGRTQPLLMFVTTRGFNPLGELAKLERKHIALLREQSKDDSSMGLIFAFDESDIEQFKNDWGKPVEEIDKGYWAKCNPGIGVAPTWRGVESMYTDAVAEGVSAQTNVMVKNFNIWVSSSQAWLPIQQWNLCRVPIDMGALRGKFCFGGFDLSSKWDLSNAGFLFPPQEGVDRFTFICKFFCPEEGVKQRSAKDKVPYQDWVAQGILTATPGNHIDFDYLKDYIEEANGIYDIRGVYYDPMFATETSLDLYERGIECTPMRQTSFQYNEPIFKLEGLIAKQEFTKGEDVILDWMFENVKILKSSTGLMMFDRAGKGEKIDGMVTLAMAMKAYLNALEKDEKSVYLERDFRFM